MATNAAIFEDAAAVNIRPERTHQKTKRYVVPLLARIAEVFRVDSP
jgi:hypothetical protein